MLRTLFKNNNKFDKIYVNCEFNDKFKKYQPISEIKIDDLKMIVCKSKLV